MPLLNLPMDEIANRYKSGETCASIARFYNTNHETIKQRLIRCGINIRPQSREFCLSTATQLYLAGNTCEKVAKILNVTEWAINKGLKQAGVNLRDNYHPDRIEQSRYLMTERVKKWGNIRSGKYDNDFCNVLKEKYGHVFPQHQIEKGGHHFDAFANGILWELDEKEHQSSTARKNKDMKYDSRARLLGYEVRHVWEWDFLEHGIDKWHYTIPM